MTTRSPAAHANVLLQANRPNDAIKVLTAWLAESPDDAECLRLLAQSHLAARSGAAGGTAALAPAQRALDLNPDDSHAWRLVSLSYSRMSMHARAAEAARTARSISPEHWATHTLVAHADASAKSVTADTRESAAEAIRLAPNEPETHFAAGHVAQASKQSALAIKHYQRTLSLDPDHVGARNNVAVLQMRRGNAGGAAAGFASLLSQNPNSDLALRNLRATGFNVLRIVYLILWLCMIALGSVSRGTQTDAIRTGGLIVAVVAVGCIGAYVLWVRHKAGAYFGRFVRSVPVTDKLLTAWALILGIVLVAIVTAVFLPVAIAQDLYLSTQYVLLVSIVVVSILNLRRKRS